ncbi:90 kDa surface protein, partial [Trypanosoma cruzi]
MRRVFCVLLVLALLCCCSCVFAVKGGEEQEQEVTQVNAVCVGKDKLGRWQLPGRSLWYNCTDAASGAGKMICGMGVGNCASEASQSRTKDGVKDAVFKINVTSPTPNILEIWWKRKVEPKAATIESGPTTRPEAEPLGPQEHKAPGYTSTTDSDSPPAGAAGASGDPPPPLPQTATPGGAVASTAADAAAKTDPSAAALGALDSAPSGELQGPSHSASAASPAPESPPDLEPTEGGDHSSHEPPVELQEETAAAP